MGSCSVQVLKKMSAQGHPSKVATCFLVPHEGAPIRLSVAMWAQVRLLLLNLNLCSQAPAMRNYDVQMEDF